MKGNSILSTAEVICHLMISNTDKAMAFEKKKTAAALQVSHLDGAREAPTENCGRLSVPNERIT